MAYLTKWWSLNDRCSLIILSHCVQKHVTYLHRENAIKHVFFRWIYHFFKRCNHNSSCSTSATTQFHSSQSLQIFQLFCLPHHCVSVSFFFSSHKLCSSSRLGRGVWCWNLFVFALSYHPVGWGPS